MENKKECCLETEIVECMLNEYMSNIQDQLETIQDNEKKLDFLLDIIAEYKEHDIRQYEFDGLQMSANDALDSSNEE